MRNIIKNDIKNKNREEIGFEIDYKLNSIYNQLSFNQNGKKKSLNWKKKIKQTSAEFNTKIKKAKNVKKKNLNYLSIGRAINIMKK